MAYYELQTEYIGRISDIFVKFLDKQTKYSFSSDLMGNQMNDLDINFTEYGEGLGFSYKSLPTGGILRHMIGIRLHIQRLFWSICPVTHFDFR